MTPLPVPAKQQQLLDLARFHEKRYRVLRKDTDDAARKRDGSVRAVVKAGVQMAVVARELELSPQRIRQISRSKP